MAEKKMFPFFYFYAYPDKIRPRISQILILPPYQRNGLCHSLLNFIYQDVNTENTITMTVEDPSENFQRVRDFLDSTLLVKLPSFSIANLIISPKATNTMIKDAAKHYKINKLQTIRVTDILLLEIAARFPNFMTTSFVETLITKRMVDHYLKSKKLSETKKNYLNQGNSISDVNDEDKFAQIKRDVDEIMEDYKRVLMRFSRSPLSDWVKTFEDGREQFLKDLKEENDKLQAKKRREKEEQQQQNKEEAAKTVSEILNKPKKRVISFNTTTTKTSKITQNSNAKNVFAKALNDQPATKTTATPITTSILKPKRKISLNAPKVVRDDNETNSDKENHSTEKLVPEVKKVKINDEQNEKLKNCTETK